MEQPLDLEMKLDRLGEKKEEKKKSYGALG